MHVEASTIVAAPAGVVAGVYRDYGRWPAVFPTISAVRLLREEAGRQVLEVDHRVEGKVVNVLTTRSPDRFEAAAGGTRFTVRGDIRLNGPRRLLAPFLRGYARRLIERFQLLPVKVVAEARDSR
jgi:hypothetical protein